MLGNGDIWSAEDALEMMHETGCDGVVVGRGCLGRPWLFADLQAGFEGRSDRVRPTLGEVTNIMQRHAALLVESHHNELAGCKDFRKHVPWYLKGYMAGRELRAALMLINSLDELRELLSQLNPAEPYPGEAAEGSRGRQGGPRRVSLPDGWLNDTQLSQQTLAMMRDAEVSVSGG